MRAVVSVVAWVLVLSVLGVVLIDEAPHRTNGERPEDFAQLYVVSWNLRHGGPIYQDTRTPPELAARLGWSYESDHAFANPPGLAPFLYPLSFLPYRVAWWGLLLSSAIALTVAVTITGRVVGLSLLVSLTAGVLLLAAPPAFVLLVLGHVEGVVVLLAVLGWLALRRGRLRIGGALWGLCAAFKLFPALWVVGLLGRRYRPAAWSALTVGIAATALGALVVGPHEIGLFLTRVLPQSARWRTGSGNFSLLSLGAWLGHPGLGWVLAAVAAVATMPSLVRNPESLDRIWVVAVPASLLISPLSWSYYVVFAAPCVVVLASHLELSRASVRAQLYLLVVTLFAWPSLLGGWSGSRLESAPYPLDVILTFVPTAGLIAMATLGLARIEASSQ